MNTQFKYISDVMENQDGQDENTKMSNTDEASRWYAAHILLYSEFLDGIQDYYNVWENIYLISARSVDEAYSKADEIGQLEEKADKDSGHTCDDRPARWLFAGVRRLAECIDVESHPEDRNEITYLEYTIRDKQTLADLLDAKAGLIVLESQDNLGANFDLLP